ncbi:MAG TPA: hypothetical protein VFR37_08105 [Longimicrobium sp.]|nr:hypothetical protein [Longimicrobium sp.]
MGSILRIVGALCIIAAAILYFAEMESPYFAPLLIAGCVLLLAGRLLQRMRRT